MAKKKRRRHLRPSIKYTLIALALILAVFCGFKAFDSFFGKGSAPSASAEASPSPTPAPTPEASPTPEPEPQEYRLSMYMLGDALIQVSCSNDAWRSDGTYDFSPQMDGIADIASNYDIAFYNQECILGGDELGITPFPHFNCPQDYGRYMISKGFNLVSTANNHSLDKGAEGVAGSEAFWAQYPEIVTDGLNLSREEREDIPVYEKNGITYAFTAWTYDMNDNLPPEGQEYMVNQYRGHEQELLNKVSEMKKKADVVIVSMHWGQEYTAIPDSEQLTLAQQLSDAGADIIIGNHAHHIQPIEWINGRTICFYALGNLLSSQVVLDVTNYEELNTGIAASLEIVKTVDPDGTSRTEIRNVRADLLFTYHTGDYEHMYSVMYKDLTDDIFPGHEEFYQYMIDTVVHAKDPDITIGLEY